MGNSVNLSKLTISIYDDDLHSHEHSSDAHIQTQPVEFPFYITKSVSEDTVLYKPDAKMAEELGMLPFLYKCSLFGLSNIVFENMGARLE